MQLDGLTRGEQDVIVLPEYANTPGMTDRQAMREFAEADGARFLASVRASAKRLGCLVVVSGIVSSAAYWFNRTMVFDACGETVATYDKMHLTDVEVDDLGLKAGAKPTVFEYADVRIGFATCFDFYFPEYFELLAAHGLDVVICPSYQRSETPERIRLIAQARAFDCGAYVIRSSYAMGSTEAGGHSLIAAPTGDLLADAGNEPCILTANIDPNRKLMKPASHGQPLIEHRSLIESHRRPTTYRPYADRSRQLAAIPYPHLCAHRGLSLACPENTLPAFAAAIAAGAHEIEFDVRTTRDGIAMICHDETVDRTTDGKGRVNELNWNEIQCLDAGTRLGEQWNGVRIPSLEQVLDLADGSFGLNIHIQGVGPDGDTIRHVCDRLIERGLVDVAYLALEREADLQVAHEHAPDIARACLVDQRDADHCLAVAKRWGCRRIQFFRDVTEARIRAAHEAGIICNLFSSNMPADGIKYVDMGIDVILTDCAHIMIAGGFKAMQRSCQSTESWSSGSFT